MALLKHDPADRITYDEFFAHDFLDLEHAPTKENYDKAVVLVHKAVDADADRNLKEAFYLYCEALRYFIPILTSKGLYLNLTRYERPLDSCCGCL